MGANIPYHSLDRMILTGYLLAGGGTGLPSISLEGVLTFITWVVENFFLIRDLVIYLMFIRHQTLLPGSIY